MAKVKSTTAFLNPNEVLDKLDLKKDMVAAEFGCGSGGFTIPLAERLEDGLVYALDIQESPLSALKGSTLLAKIINVHIIRCDLEQPRGSTLQDASLDVVLVPNVLFQIDNKDAVLAEAARILKPKGKLLIIDWQLKVSQGPSEGRVGPEKVKKLADKHGFQLKKEFSAGAYHYGLLFTKP